MIYLPVDEVKIYRNSAVVHRKATVGLSAGVNEVILSGVSTTADPDSLRLFFSEGVTCLDVQIIPMSEAVGRLPSEEAEEEIAALQSRIGTLQSIEELWIANGNFSARGEATTETIAGYLDELPGRVEALRNQRKELETQVGALQKKKEKLAKKEAFQAVRVQLEAAAGFEADCAMEYSERSARWNSTYEIHTDTDAAGLNVISRARILQDTGEDWNNVRVSLLTGNPLMPQVLPSMRQMSLRFKGPISPVAPLPPHFTAPTMPVITEPLKPGETSKLHAAPLGRAYMPPADEMDGDTMTEYLLPGGRTICSGTVGMMADIKTEWVPARQCVICVPRQNCSAYLSAVIKTADWHLKPSSAKLYLNRNYCGTIQISPDLTKETFLLSFGKDERFSVSRESVRDVTEDVLLMKQKRRNQEFAIRVSNNTEQPHSILVADQVPVPFEKQITVDRISANGASFNPENGALSWNLTVAGKETAEMRLAYTTTYPKDEKLQEGYQFNHIEMKTCPQCGAFNMGRICSVCGAQIP